MDEEFNKILQSLEQLKRDRLPKKELLSETKDHKTWLKLEPFDYNLELFFSLTLVVEDKNENSVETSIDQIQLDKPIFVNDLREKFIHTKEELLEELISFQTHSKE